MESLSRLPDAELLARMPRLVLSERSAIADVIEHLIEIDARRLYLGEACSSLYAYCRERLGYGDDEALSRVRLARLARRYPRALEELRSGAIHLTGLFLLSQHVTDENADFLFDQARGKTKRQIAELLAAIHPKSDVPEQISPQAEQLSVGVPAGPSTWAGPCKPSRPGSTRPLSPKRWAVQFTA